MDQRVIEQKLENLRYCVDRVEKRCPEHAETLALDPDTQDIVVLNLSRAVQQCVDIGAHVIANAALVAPDTMGGTFDRLADAGFIDAELAARLKRSVGFRNIAVHNYEAIDWEVVHAIGTRHLGDFRSFAQAVKHTLTAGPPG